ncbi:site-specific integrase [uncultured Arcticibacterium sp.]|uniref:site-specific integrase n=1 Tax=uncultured Arcticibacterium sp. TaxID=2173042 RepID=UPI0030FC38CD
MLGVTLALIQDTRTIKKDGTYPLKLRVTYNRDQKYYSIGLSYSEDDWTKINSIRPGKEFRQIKLLLSKIESRADDIIKEIFPFTFEDFEKRFNAKPKKTSDLLSSFDDYEEMLRKENRIGTAESYKSARSSFTKFLASRKKKKALFKEITSDWLNEYENWMLDKGNSISSVGIYTRSLRTIFNKAIDEGKVDRSFYPFGKRKYQIPASQNIKKALTLAEIKLISNYKAKNNEEQKAIDLWMFTYLCNGINVKDIARLQFKNINSKSITFLRAKTERSSRSNLKNVSVAILPESAKILKRWGQNDMNPENYVFGFLDGKETPEQERAKIKQVNKTINLHTKRLGETLGFELKLTTYSARHSFATVLKRSGAPIEYISESLGHKDLRTTENYLDSFEDDIKVKYQEKLLDF